MKSEEYLKVLTPKIIKEFQEHVCFKFFVTTLEERIESMRDRLEAGKIIIKQGDKQEIHYSSMEEIKFFQGGSFELRYSKNLLETMSKVIQQIKEEKNKK